VVPEIYGCWLAFLALNPGKEVFFSGFVFIIPFGVVRFKREFPQDKRADLAIAAWKVPVTSALRCGRLKSA
jgi:hypothetical protein